VAPNPIILAQRTFAANIRGFAERSLQWLNQTEGSWSGGEYQINISPWLEHVKTLASQVKSRKVGKPAASASMDCLVFGTGNKTVAARLHQHGLNPLRERDPTLVSGFVNFLLHSGIQPKADGAADGLVDVVEKILGIQFTKLGDAWDLAPP
jgi:hypothetical protein